MISAISDLLLLARLAALEYTVNVDQIAQGVNALGLGFIAQVGSDECQALVADWNGRPVVCFRGTQVLQNTSFPELGDDLEVHRMGSPIGGTVHVGFWRPLAALWPEIAAVLPSVPPVFTGHSLGGVRAQLAPALLPGRPTETVSFGAPKGGDSAFWQALGTRPSFARIVHEEDFAPEWNPLLPWSTHPQVDIGWLHNGRLYRVPQRTTWINESIADHSVDLYVNGLAALAALVEPPAKAA